MLNKLNQFLTTIIPSDTAPIRSEHTLQLATAVLLIEVMRSDAESTDQELATIINILKGRFNLSDTEVAKSTELGHHQSKKAHDLHQFTSLINRELERTEKVHIIEYMWKVAYADKQISAHENHLMRKLVGLLHISHADNISAKMRAESGGLE